jgi:glutaredoxin 3
VKEFLSQKGIAYTERDISKDEQAVTELAEMNQFTTPVVMIDDEVVVGFNRTRLEALLAKGQG